MDWNNINRDKDTSGLGPIEYDQTKVPNLIRQYADDVRTKTYGQEVREAQARNAELAGLIAQEANDVSKDIDGRQEVIESRYDVAVGAMTEDSEVLDARVNKTSAVYPNLKRRIDNQQYFVTISEFGAVGDGVTDDTLAVQKAIDYAVENDKHLYIDGNFNIAGTLYLNWSYGYRIPRIITGYGKLIKNNAGFLFSSKENYAGNIRFHNFTIQSVEGSGMTVIDRTRLIRLYHNSVHFQDVDHYSAETTTLSKTENNYIQTIYFMDSSIVGGIGWFVDTPIAYDLSFSHNVIEHRSGDFVKSDANHSVRIIDNLIEGIGGQVFKGAFGRGLTIDDNYFESNARGADGNSVNKPYIEITKSSADINGSIKSNDIHLSPAQSADSNYYPIKIDRHQDSFSIKNNNTDGNLIDVVLKETISTEMVKMAYSNQFENKSRNAIVGGFKPIKIVQGQGNLTKVWQRPFDWKTGITYSQNKILSALTDKAYMSIDANQRLVVNNVDNLQSREIAIQNASPFKLYSGINYVMGIKGNFLKKDGDYEIELTVISNTNSNIYSRYPLSDKFIANYNFISLPAFTVPTTDDYKIRLYIRNKTTSDWNQILYIEQIVLQEGTVASQTSPHTYDSKFNGDTLRLGNHIIYVDSAGKLRIKENNIASETDGTVIGTQS